MVNDVPHARGRRTAIARALDAYFGNTPRTRRIVFPPYLRALEAALAEIQAVAPDFDRGIDPPRTIRERIDTARIRTDEGLRRRVPLLQRVYPPRPVFGERGRGPEADWP